MNFTKMHGLGNDYLFINCFEETVDEPAELSIAMSDRHTGAGSDGIILVLPSEESEFRMRIFNADGSEAETCGNGIRCFAKYVFDHGLTDKPEFVVETLAGPNRVWLDVDDGVVKTVRSNMGRPEFDRDKIPMKGSPGDVIEEELIAAGSTYVITCISMGNPHTIIFVDDVDAVRLAETGPAIETHRSFPNRTNVEFVQMDGRTDMRVRVWERGSGITLACGSGTCAAAVAAMRTGRAERTVTAHLDLGDLDIEWAEDGSVFMTGPATEVYTGEWPSNGNE